MIKIATIAVIAALLTRLFKAAEPLWNRIPEACRWVPPVLLAVIASVGSAAAQQGAAWTDLADACITGAVAGLGAIGTREAALRLTRQRDPLRILVPKVPDLGRIPPVLLVLLVGSALWLTGCVGSFEEAKWANPAYQSSKLTASTAAVAQPSERCVGLDNAKRTWTAIAAGAAVVTGGSGLSTIPIEDQGTRIGLAVGAAAAAVVGGVALAEVTDLGSAWIRECSQPGNEVQP